MWRDFGNLCLQICCFVIAMCLQKLCSILFSLNFFAARFVLFFLENILDINKSKVLVSSILKYIVPQSRDNNNIKVIISHYN